MKRIEFVSLCMMRNMKGRSALKVGISGPIEVLPTITAVAAAASVPSSFTFTKDLCSTAETNRGSIPALRPLRSDLKGSKASTIPRASRGSFRL